MVAAGVEQDDVVHSVKVVCRVACVDALQTCHSLAVVELCHIAQFLTCGGRFGADGLNLGVVTLQISQKFVEVAGFQLVFRNDIVLHNVVEFEHIAAHAGKNQNLAANVKAAQIDGRVWFGQALFASLDNGLRERNVAADGVENIVQTARQHGLNLHNLVARSHKVLNRLQNRQTGCHVRLVQEFHAAGLHFLLEFEISLKRRRSHNLVRSHNRDAQLRHAAVHFRQFVRSGVVDEDAVAQVQLLDILNVSRQVGSLGGVGQKVAPIGKVDAFAVENHFFRVRYAHHADVDSVLVFQEIGLVAQLVEHCAAHRANAHHKQVHAFVFRQEEAVVQRVQRLCNLFFLDYYRYVALCCALRDGSDVDAVLAQQTEGLSGDAHLLAHFVAHHGDDGKAVFRLDGVHNLALNLNGEFLVQAGAGLLGVVGVDAHADGVLARRLGDEQHVHISHAKRLEGSHCHARHPNHSAARNGYQRYVAD